MPLPFTVPLLLAVLAAIVLAGCERPGTPGVSRGDLTGDGEDRCMMEDAFRAGLKRAKLSTKLSKPEQAKPVILHEGSQAEADSADTPIHFEVKGALLICRFVVGDELEADMSLRYFGAADDRTGFEDAVAWTWALDDVYLHDLEEGVKEATAKRLAKASDGDAFALGKVGRAHAIATVASVGEGSSAALELELIGGPESKVTPEQARTVAETMAGQLGS